jgi:sterol 3beta-glucosyltransferase
MIANAGAGPKPIPPKQLTITSLAEAIKFALSDEARAAARVMGDTIRAEDGVKLGVNSFHRHLPVHVMK